MERVKIRAQTFEKALTSLEVPIKKSKMSFDKEIQEMIRDSLIKRFEYTFETFWQFLKQLLEDSYGIQAVGTRNIFKEALRINLISESELEILLNMVLDRNETVHAYKENVADEIAQDIPDYYKTMKTIFERLQKTL